MRVLIDAQLPPGLCDWFRERGVDADHVAGVLGGQTPDATIAAHAKASELVLITKDDDFRLRFPPGGFTPKPTWPISIAASAKKRWANMASKMSKADSPTGGAEQAIDMAEFGRRIAARKAELGLPDPPRNAGNNRTASKRALLKAIEDAGGSW